jgi:hypothetical protein
VARETVRERRASSATSAGRPAGSHRRGRIAPAFHAGVARAVLVLLVSLFGAVACSARKVELVNASGHRTECTAEGVGWGALGTDAMIDGCVAKLEAKGYRRGE